MSPLSACLFSFTSRSNYREFSQYRFDTKSIITFAANEGEHSLFKALVKEFEYPLVLFCIGPDSTTQLEALMLSAIKKYHTEFVFSFFDEYVALCEAESPGFFMSSTAQTLLVAAGEFSSLDLIECLIKGFAKIHSYIDESLAQEAAFKGVAGKGDSNLLRVFAGKWGGGKRLKTFNHGQCIFAAIRSGSAECVRTVLELLGNPSLPLSFDDLSFESLAFRGSDQEIVEFLSSIDHLGADLQTLPIEFAISSNRSSLLSSLLASSALPLSGIQRIFSLFTTDAHEHLFDILSPKFPKNWKKSLPREASTFPVPALRCLHNRGLLKGNSFFFRGHYASLLWLHEQGYSINFEFLREAALLVDSAKGYKQGLALAPLDIEGFETENFFLRKAGRICSVFLAEGSISGPLITQVAESLIDDRIEFDKAYWILRWCFFHNIFISKSKFLSLAKGGKQRTISSPFLVELWTLISRFAPQIGFNAKDLSNLLQRAHSRFKFPPQHLEILLTFAEKL